MTFKQSAISGIKWSYFSQFGREAIQLITTIVLTRLLAPSDFGLMAMLTVVTGFASIFTDLGISAVIIKRRAISEDLLSSILLLNVFIGLLTTVIVYLCSPLIAIFYNNSQLISYSHLMSIIFLICSMGIVQKALLEQKLQFKIIARIEIVATLIGSIIGIVSAAKNCGVSSLIYQALATTAVTTILLCLVCPQRFRFTFNWNETKTIIRFGLNLSGFSMVNYFSRNADNILIGKFLGAESLGYYSLAYRVMFYPLQSIAGGIGRVMFPIYSHMQDDNNMLREVFLKVTGIIGLVTFPLMSGVCFLAEPFVLAFFGYQWQAVALLLMILAPVGMIQSIQTNVGYIYMVKDRTSLLLYWAVISGIMEIIGFFVGMQWGIIGVAVVYAVLSAILTYPGFAIPFKLISLPMNHLFRTVWRPFVCSFLMIVILFMIKWIIPHNLSNNHILLFFIPLGAIFYIMLSWFLNRTLMIQVIDTLRAKA